jgi:uncharacterized membrane protein
LAGLILTVVVAVGGGLRLRGLTTRSIWHDEAFSWRIATQFSVSEMIERTAQDVHPPLYYFVLRIWTTQFGHSVPALRSLSVILGVATIVWVYLLCVEAFGVAHHYDSNAPGEGGEERAIGVLAASLLATSAIHIHWSSEARMYTLATALVVASSWLLLRAQRASIEIEAESLASRARGLKPQFDANAYWIGYVATATALLYTHNYGLFSVAAQAVVVGVWLLRQSLGCWTSLTLLTRFFSPLVAFVLVGILYAPWIPILRAQTAQVQAEYWIDPIRWLTVPNAWYQVFFPGHFGRPVPEIGALAVGIVLLSVLFAFVWNGRTGHWFAFSMVAIPTLLPALVSATTVSIIHPRHFLLPSTFVMCAIAAVVFRYLRRPECWFVAALFVGDNVLIYRDYWRSLDIDNRPGIRGAVDHLLSRRGGGEPIVVRHPCVYFVVHYLTRGIAEPKLFLPTGRTSHYTGNSILVREDYIGHEELQRYRGKRVWMMDTDGFTRGFERPPLPPGWEPVGSTESFRDVYSFQGSVWVTPYEWKEQ